MLRSRFTGGEGPPTTCGKTWQGPLLASGLCLAELDLVACKGERIELPVLSVCHVRSVAKPSELEDRQASKACRSNSISSVSTVLPKDRISCCTTSNSSKTRAVLLVPNGVPNLLSITFYSAGSGSGIGISRDREMRERENFIYSL